ncbi:MAG: MFS transporter [Actinomycetaceae bacterium]
MSHRLRLLQAAVFLSSFDRMLIAPLVPVVAGDLGVTAGAAAGAATSYFVGYGLMQAVWGRLSDRYGRVRTAQASLILAAVAGGTSALAPTLTVLIVLRALTGAAFAAVVPGSLIYIGDTVPAAERHAPVAGIMRSTAVGMALATVVAGVLGETLGWRVALTLPALLALIVAVSLSRLPEPGAGPRAGGLLAPLRSRWALLVLGLTFVEGAVVLGLLPLLPTVLQIGGTSVTASGLVTAAYGAVLVVTTGAVQAVGRRLSAPGLMAVGVVCGTVAYLVLEAWPSPVGVLVASALLAGTWAFLHSTMQVWAIEVLPSARAAMISLYATSLFLGSSVGTAAASPALTTPGGHPFLVAAAVLALLGVIVVVARRRNSS